MKEWTTIGRVMTLCLALTGGAAFAQDEAPAAPAPAAEPSAEFPSAASLFDKHTEAIGGKDKVFGETTRMLSGTLKIFVSGEEAPRQTGIMRLTAKAPNSLIQEIVFPGQSTEQRKFDGKAGWVTKEDGTATPMGPEELERITVAANFYAESDYENQFKSIETVEQQEIEGDTINVVKVVHFSGRTEAFLFSEKSGLLVGVIGTRMVGEQMGQFRRSYEDYKDFGSGILTPTVVREVVGNLMFEMTFNKVETGIDFPELKRPENIPDADLSGFRKP